ncbi:MAG TPA: DUF11 domain-containing protein [Actinomycetota bacterium]
MEKGPGQQPQQGAHLRGTYPSDATGIPSANGASNPVYWSNVVQAGGQNTPGTNVQNYALCAQSPAPGQANLSITKAEGWDPIVTGGRLTYTLTVSNAGPQAATGVVASDALPAWVIFVSASSTQGGCSNAAGTVTCTIGNLANGATAIATIDVRTPLVPGVITNTATVGGNEADPTPGNNSATVTTTISDPPPDVDLSITKIGTPDPVTAGGDLAYTLTVANNGPEAATGVVVIDSLPAGATFVSASSGCTNASGTVACTIGNLANGASASRTITVTAPASAGTISNTASVVGNEGDPVTGNNSATTTTTVKGKADVSLRTTAQPARVKVGEAVTYTLAVHNAGPSSATSVLAADMLPSNLSYVSATPSRGSCSVSGRIVACNLGTFGPGTNATITVVGKATRQGTAINAAGVKAAELDPVLRNNVSVAIVKVTR